MLGIEDIKRVRLAHFIAPEGHPLAGNAIVVDAFAIAHPSGLVLFDTGMESDPELDAHYRSVRRPLRDALQGIGMGLDDVKVIVNCHLHFDHGGGNHNFPGVPIFAQRAELDSVHGPEEYTRPAMVADFPGATFEVLDGEGSPWPGLRIFPTPGHVTGHQSMVVETREGRIVLAGQAFDSATDFSRANVARQEGVRPGPAWLAEIAELDPVRVVFAHDVAMWERPQAGYNAASNQGGVA